ncbi:MAG TPA: hypothetical protein VNR18_02130 [Hyphomicrobiales bacterium]|nr:hypothetical protein [Hyphomicrobiales bacterium]
MIKNKQAGTKPDAGSGLDGDALKVADEISGYLAQRDGAADTFQGLVSWWLFRQRLVDAEHKVRLAVEYLCERGVIRKHALADGSVLYMAAPKAANAEAQLAEPRGQGMLKIEHSKRR